MRRLAALALVLAAAAPARADDEDTSDREIGGRVGARLNLGGLGAGGLHLAGVFLQRLTDEVWFDAQFVVTFGGDTPACYLARDLSTTCDPSLARGVSAQLLGGPRWYFTRWRRFTLLAAAGAGLAFTSFASDNLTGVSIPIWFGVGARTPLGKGAAFSAELLLSGGPTYLDNHDNGVFFAASLVVGVDFEL